MSSSSLGDKNELPANDMELSFKRRDKTTPTAPEPPKQEYSIYAPNGLASDSENYDMFGRFHISVENPLKNKILIMFR